MFQSELKEEFIQDYMRSRVIARTSLYSLFRKTEQYERKLNKDCSLFSQEEILEMYKDFRAKSVYVLLNYTSILKAYCAWKGYYHEQTTENAYTTITTQLLKPCIPETANKFLSRQEIIEIEDQLYNWTDKAIVECLWEGISGNSMSDLIGITAQMIDKKTKELYLPNKRIVPLTDRLLTLLIKAFEEDEYLCYGKTIQVKKMTGKGRLYKERDNANGLDSDDKKFRWVYRKIQNFRAHVGIPDLTMKNIHISGMYHYLKEGMRETNLNLKDFLMSPKGLQLADKYRFASDYRIDNLVFRFKDYV